MKILFAPDWRNGVPYQRLLAEALIRRGIQVEYLEGYRRVLPLRRLFQRVRCDILHMHWPEAYYPQHGDRFDWFRRARFAFDLQGALRHCKLATTAHNLHAHNRPNESFGKRNTRVVYENAGAIFAHSTVAKKRIIESFHVPAEKIHIIPHGDLSVTLGRPVPRGDARVRLNLDPAKTIVLIFGAVEPYKGQEEIIQWWKKTHPSAHLAIVGKPVSTEYQAHISALIGTDSTIHTQFGWLSDEQLRDWLCASEAVLFNYRTIFTSGAANLARAWGIPQLLPARLDTVVLDEPSPYVHRFASLDELGLRIREALKVQPDFDAAADWRKACSWDEVARITAEGYEQALHSVAKR